MPFWLAFGVAQEFEGGGRHRSVTVFPSSFASFDDAANSLVDVDAPVTTGRVTEANAYVVEADTAQQVSLLVRAVLRKEESSSQVHVVQRHIRTRQMPEEPPEVQALNRLHGELCITHQLTELALTCMKGDEHRARLEQHKVALEDFGHAVLVMRGGDVPTGDEALSGSERLGYSHGHIAGAESATFDGTLGALARELWPARYQAALAKQVVSPSDREVLHDLRIELDRFGTAVTEMRRQSGSRE